MQPRVSTLEIIGSAYVGINIARFLLGKTWFGATDIFLGASAFLADFIIKDAPDNRVLNTAAAAVLPLLPSLVTGDLTAPEAIVKAACTGGAYLIYSNGKDIFFLNNRAVQQAVDHVPQNNR